MFAWTLLFSFALTAQAPSTTLDLQDFFHEVWSPYCKGNSLMECPSGDAEKLRRELTQRYQAGQSTDELKDFLAARYGKEMRMQPDGGFRGLMAYLIPWIAFFAIVGFLISYWKRRTRNKVKETPSTQESNSKSVKPTTHSAIEKELRERLS